MDCGNGMGSNGSGDKVGFSSFQADEGRMMWAVTAF